MYPHPWYLYLLHTKLLLMLCLLLLPCGTVLPNIELFIYQLVCWMPLFKNHKSCLLAPETHASKKIAEKHSTTVRKKNYKKLLQKDKKKIRKKWSPKMYSCILYSPNANTFMQAVRRLYVVIAVQAQIIKNYILYIECNLARTEYKLSAGLMLISFVLIRIILDLGLLSLYLCGCRAY